MIPTDMWKEDTEAVITNWLVPDGGRVGKGMLIAEIMVEKSQFEVMAPAEGVLAIEKQTDAIVRKGDLIGHIK